jgi:integrative and conjugative element protein (TIGR02256 family)
MCAPIDYPLYFEGYRRRVWVAEGVLNVWHCHRQTDAHNPEAFGVLVGTTSIDKRELWIDIVTSPMRRDVQSRYHFELKDPGHQRTVDRSFHRSGGSQIYLGTWHTHPDQAPTPSHVDKSDWRQCLNRNKKRPLLFVIAGTHETRIFVPWGGDFRRLTMREKTNVR